MRAVNAGTFFSISLLLLLMGLVGCGGSGFTPTSPQALIVPTQNPLVAQVTIQVPGAANSGQAMVEFGLTTSYGRQTALYPLSGALGSATFLVAGMQPSSTYHLRAHVMWNGSGFDWTGTDQTFTTGALPSNLAFPKLVVSRPNPSSTENPGVELVNLVPSFPSNVVEAVVSDRDGNPIWYYDVGVQQGNYPSGFKLLPNGNMIFLIESTTTATVSLRETDLAGNIVHSLTLSQLQQNLAAAGFSYLPDGWSHDVLALPNGHLVLITASSQSFTDLPGYPGTINVAGDGLVDLDPDWNPVWTWSAFDYLDINRHLAGLPDWTHANAIIYSPEDGNLMLSLRHQAWILKIDYENGTGSGRVLWRLGNQGDFALTNGGPSDWFFFQHYPWLLSQTNGQNMLAVWDNGNDRVSEDANAPACTPLGGPGCYSRATIFQVDENALTATLQWANAPGYFSPWGGSIGQFSNGNVEFDINSPIPFPAPNVGAEIQEVRLTSNPQIIWKMDVSSGNAYRGYRIPSLYPGVTWAK